MERGYKLNILEIYHQYSPKKNEKQKLNDCWGIKMIISKQQVGELFQKVKDEKVLKELLQEIFSHKENIETFSQVVFPETICNKIPEFHKEIYEMLFREENDAFAAPRGHAKTSVTGIIFLIFNIVNKLEKYIVYISQNHAKTVQFIDPIRHEFKNNKMLRFIF